MFEIPNIPDIPQIPIIPALLFLDWKLKIPKFHIFHYSGQVLATEMFEIPDIPDIPQIPIIPALLFWDKSLKIPKFHYSNKVSVKEMIEIEKWELYITLNKS